MQYNQNNALIIAHRGAKSLAPAENTVDAFQIAIDLNIKMVEFDVRKTKDNNLVIFHNPSINGLLLSEITYDELCIETNKEGFIAPLLTDVLFLCKDKIKLDIELKEAGYEELVINVILKYFNTNDFIITSFIDSVLIKVKQLNPNIKTGLLLGVEHAGILKRLSELFPLMRLRKSKADFVVANYLLVTIVLHILCKIFHYDIYVWTVNKDNIYNKLIKRKVKAIITDYPQKYNGQFIVNS